MNYIIAIDSSRTSTSAKPLKVLDAILGRAFTEECRCLMNKTGKSNVDDLPSKFKLEGSHVLAAIVYGLQHFPTFFPNSEIVSIYYKILS